MLRQWILHFGYIILFQTLCVSSAKKSSLAFIIDETVSMTNEIDQVRRAAGEIMDIVLKEKGSEIEDVILVTINDPYVELKKKTSNKVEFLDALNKLYVHDVNNYDCPEYALSGVEKALQESRQGSYLYVFTDASAKDHLKVNEIKALCQKKQSQVVFIISGDCVGYAGGEFGSFTVYYDIAKACNGQVFDVKENEVLDVVNAIKKLLQGDNTVITTNVVPASTADKPVQFAVDDKTEYVTISTTGRNVDVTITDSPTSGGRIFDTEKILWKPTAKMVKVEGLAPGTYYAWVKGDTEVTIVVYARTDFKFDHGFSSFEPESIEDVSKQPIANQKNHLTISVTDPEHSVEIKTAEILDMNGNVITQLPLRKGNGDFYITDAFVSPSALFKIQVTGIVKATGKPIKRISRTSIEPQLPPTPVHKAPVVTITGGSKVNVDFYGEVLLTCKVSGYPNPRIWWTSSDGTNYGEKSSIVELPYDYINYLKVTNVTTPGKYYCNAQNSQGQQLQEIEVVPGCFIDRTDTAQNIPLLFGNEATAWPQIRTNDKFYVMRQNEVFTLECATLDQPTNTFQLIPNAKTIKAECYNKDEFKVDGKIYKFKDLQCTEPIKPFKEVTKKPCMKNGETVKVGFNLNGGYLSVYEVCFSEKDQRPLYTKVEMSNDNNTNGPPFILQNEIKTGDHDNNPLENEFVERPLVSPNDVAFGPAQTSTMPDIYNSVRVYEPCKESLRWTWTDVQKSVQFSLNSSKKVTAWTGASHYSSYGVPRYLWKMVRFDDGTFEAIVFVNVAHPKNSDILCPKTTSKRLGSSPANEDQYTYFCSKEDFLRAFKYSLSDFGI